MSYKIGKDEKNEHVVLLHQGNIVFDEIKVATSLLKLHISVSGLKKILVDMTEASHNLGQFEHFQIAESIKEGLPPNAKIAVVESIGNYQRHGNYLESAAESLGIEMKAFMNKTAAIDWLNKEL